MKKLNLTTGLILQIYLSKRCLYWHQCSLYWREVLLESPCWWRADHVGKLSFILLFLILLYSMHLLAVVAGVRMLLKMDIYSCLEQSFLCSYVDALQIFTARSPICEFLKTYWSLLHLQCFQFISEMVASRYEMLQFQIFPRKKLLRKTVWRTSNLVINFDCFSTVLSL